ncbi:MAG: GAF domain-containing protein [Prochloraceae cyanobacterium]|nr:GAF domain-containing protein [Prochloraceae cyanobacterium]
MEAKNIVPEENYEKQAISDQEQVNKKEEIKSNGNGSSLQPKDTQRDKIEQFKRKLFKQERDRASKIIKQIRQSQDIDSFLFKTTAAIQEELQLDRVFIYRFDPKSEGQKGQVVAESLVRGWTPAIDEILPCIGFGSTYASEYESQGFVAIEDVEREKLTAYQKQLLQKFQVRASLAFPILVNDTYASEDKTYELDKVWGLLVVQQCEEPRQWQEDEINLLYQISVELTLGLQQDQPRLQLSQQKDIFTTINQEMQILMQEMVDKIRGLLKADRVLAYGFNPDWSGKVLAESVDSNWKRAGSTFDKDYFLKGEQYKPYYVVNDIYAKDFARCLIEALEKLQAKAYILVPIEQNSQLQGVIAAYQNSGPRNWQQSEVNLMLKFARQFSFPLQQTAFIRKTAFQTEQMELAFQREKDLNKMVERMRTAKDEETAFQIATQEGRKILGVDRLAIYRFNSDWSGEFISESVGAGWSSLIENIPVVKDTYLQENRGGRYKFGECFAVDDIYNIGHQPCHVELLEQFEARAYAIAPVMLQDKKLWGLVGAYQNNGVRKWQEDEIDALRQIGIQLGIAMQRIEYVGKLEARAEQEQSIAKIVDRIRQSLNLYDILKTATQEVRQLLKADRVVAYRFNPDWSGEVVAESMTPGWVSVMDIQQVDKTLYSSEMSADGACTIRDIAAGSALDKDTYLRETKGGGYQNGRPFRSVNDIYKAGFSACYIESLEKYQAKAYIIAPIIEGGQMWGLFAAYQNSGPRDWQDSELKLLTTVGAQLGVAVQQAEYAQKIQLQSQQDKAVARIVERIRSSVDLKAIFSNSTQEVRRLLEADRAVIYRFNLDWSGEVLAESVTAGWVSVMEIQQTDDTLYNTEMSADERCNLKDLRAGSAFDTDTYLKETQGGGYAKGEAVKVINDVYAAGFSPCYLGSLEKYQARAYIIAPIFKNDRLWGLFGVYQNSQARTWTESEIKLILQLTSPLGLAIQQAEYIDQLQLKSSLEQGLTQIVEEMQQADSTEAVFSIATQEAKQLFNVDRVTVCRFNSNWSGQFIAESSLNGNAKSMKGLPFKDDDTYLQQTQGGRYKNNECFAVNDVYQSLEDCHIKLLEPFSIKAYMVAPIFVEQKLWGLIAAYQHNSSRYWQQEEILALKQIGTQIVSGMEKINYLTQLKSQSQDLAQTLEREKAAKDILEKRAVEILSAVRPAFKGNLTVRATVTDDQLGTIAAAYNTTLQALQDIVLQVKNTVEQISHTTNSNNSSIRGLSTKAQLQFEELNLALAKIQDMIEATEVANMNAQQVESAIAQANQTVKSGDKAMNKSVESIMEIRQTVTDAGKRVKRLSESSQRISKVVNLISSFATQTNLLALNAALEATRAGEYGKGFAVVADEVRNLSLQSAEATTEIEKLIQNIQEETREVAAAMERGVEQVSEGTNLVNETRESLNEIVTSTAEISLLIEGITTAANAQTQEAESVMNVMGQVAAIANETSSDSMSISASFQELLEMASELQANIAKFKVQ